MLSGDTSFHVGVDENGLGARLGPLVVTAVMAEVTAHGRQVLERPPRGKLRLDLDDSKRLVSHSNVELGEAWARELTRDAWSTPEALFQALSLEEPSSLEQHCPGHLRQQCWSAAGEAFAAPAEQRRRIAGHIEKLASRGVRVAHVRVASACTLRLNRARRDGRNRFLCDLHAMEALLIEMRRHADRDLNAVCGKVGGMSDYHRFFGPLSGHLHTELGVTKKKSSYYFPGLGQVHFVQDADARHPLVMLASLVGKWVRELLMARIVRFHTPEGASGGAARATEPVSGYHDPRTSEWVVATEPRRRSLRVALDCFEREREREIVA
jgi:ribonuclease HII